ncbi:MAG: hypothetical protein IPL98_07785 [Saprospiraceae bacterium]|nr:hypothetical protein [Saprospiraceae bacterium]
MELELAIKLSPFFDIDINYRYYQQSAIDDFLQNIKSIPLRKFYSSDYDLFTRSLVKIWIRIKWKPLDGVR